MSDFTRPEHAALARAAADADWDAALAEIADRWSMLVQHDAPALLAVLEKLPPSVLIAQPRYLSARTYLRHLVDDDGLQTQRYRHPTYERAPVELTDTLVEHTSRAAAARNTGAFTTASAHVDRARATLEAASADDVERVQTALPHLHAQWARVRELAGELDLAITEYQDAFDLSRLTGDDLVSVAAAASLAGLHALAGHTDASARWARAVDPERFSASTTKYATPARLARALRHIDRLRGDWAAREIAAIDPAALGEYWAHVLFVRARLLPTPDEIPTLLTEIDVAVAAHPGAVGTTGLTGELIASARIDLLLSLGAVARAVDVLERAEDAAAASNRVNGFEVWPPRPGHLTLARARVEIASGQSRRAVTTLDPLIAAATSRPRLLVESILAMAVAQLRNGDESSAGEAARHAVRIASEYGLLAALASVSREDLTALARHAGLEDDRTLTQVLAGARFPEAPANPSLTAREQAVLRELASGATTTEIATRLFVSPNTVKSQLSSTYRKLGVSSRAEAEAAARRIGLAG